MSYIERYPELVKRYRVSKTSRPPRYPNFEELAKTFDTHFSHLFNLEALNAACLTEPDGSYMKLFDMFMEHLDGEVDKKFYTHSYIVEKIYALLADERHPIRKALLDHFIFIPPIGAKAQPQLGFLEKIATDSFRMAEPVTFIDMMRLVEGLRVYGEKTRKVIPAIKVVNLKDLDASNTVAIIGRASVLVVNFNDDPNDPKATPKWGVVNFMTTTTPPTVYCEMPLLEREKAKLTSVLGSEFTYEKAEASSLASTGYTAIAWLDKTITKVWSFDHKADFASLMQDYCFIQFAGDNPGKTFKYSPGEKKYNGPRFTAVAGLTLLGADSAIDPTTFTGGQLFTTITYSASTGTLIHGGGTIATSWKPGDIGSLIRACAERRIDSGGMTPSFNLGMATLPPNFATTLERNGYLVSDTNPGTSNARMILTIPDPLSVLQLITQHRVACADKAEPAWLADSTKLLSTLDRVEDRGVDPRAAAAIMIMSLIRARAKQPEIVISLPDVYQLTPQEQGIIISALQENAYITEFTVGSNASLNLIKAKLNPIFARNRLLAMKGYHPAMVDDYWSQAAHKWLLHLKEHPRVIDLDNEPEFKRCVQEMGLAGLNAILAVLGDMAQKEFISGLYKGMKPTFYAACPAEELPAYLGSLYEYLSAKSFFPFKELGISYQANPATDALFIETLGQINQLESMDRIVLTEFLPRTLPYHAHLNFLRQLTTKAYADGWTGLIVIPELEQKTNTSANFCELRAAYALLNDVILGNQHAKTAKKVITDIAAASKFDAATLPVVGAGAAGAGAAAMPIGTAGAMPASLANLGDTFNLPLAMGGEARLQMQQQHQIQQNRQIKQEQQRVTLHKVEDALIGPLVDYSNVEEILAPYLRKLTARGFILRPEFTSLTTHGVHPLKNLFHSWINANPAVPASNIIRKMTKEAAHVLLRKHRMLSSGLNPENLPKGFFTQRTKDGDLVLCYKAELSYVGQPNAFTLALDVDIPEAKPWDGDFRQFDLTRYLSAAPLEDKDWVWMTAFARLQPAKDHTADYAAFCATNPTLTARLDPHKALVIHYWPIFLQIWQYKGLPGLDAFVEKIQVVPRPELDLSIEAIRPWLVNSTPGGAPDLLLGWFNATCPPRDLKFSLALGQVFHKFGREGVRLFLTKLQQIHGRLGDDFFAVFYRAILSPEALETISFNTFMQPDFFCAMDKMMEKLEKAGNEYNLHAWKVLLQKHMASTEWDNVVQLWEGFEYFLQEIEEGMGLKFSEHQFDFLLAADVPRTNVLVYLDRLLESLKQIPEQGMQQKFLEQLATFDMTNGGVPYALKHEGFRYVDSGLHLTNFAHGTPTYAPNLKDLYRWGAEPATALKLQRAIASQRKFTHQDCPVLITQLGLNTAPTADAKHVLMVLLNTNYQTVDIAVNIADIRALNPGHIEAMARHLHSAVYEHGNQQLSINFDALKAVVSQYYRTNTVLMGQLFAKYPNGTSLEVMSIMHQKGEWNPSSVNALATLLNSRATPATTYFEREIYKLAALFGMVDPAQLQEFFRLLETAPPIAKQELRQLMTHILSIDFKQSLKSEGKRAADFNHLDNWSGFINTLKQMTSAPQDSAAMRLATITALEEKGFVFRFSRGGDYRALLDDKPEDQPDLSAFVDHQNRLKKFMFEHIAIPAVPDTTVGIEALQPIIRFLKVLQLNRTYLNEIEPLLASLEVTKEGTYWSVEYFNGLLQALQPENAEASFPISMLKMMLQEPSIGAQPMDHLKKEFPEELKKAIQIILKHREFNLEQKTLLCQLAVREYKWENKIVTTFNVITLLENPLYAESRSHALDILTKSESSDELNRRVEKTSALLRLNPDALVIRREWPKTAALWLKSMSSLEKANALFAQIDTLARDEQAKINLLHIIAWSTLNQGLKDKDAHKAELDRKASKLAEKIARLPAGDIAAIARCYPKQPAPTADDLLRLIKATTTAYPLQTQLSDFLNKPFAEARGDYSVVASTRDADLRRMLTETKISEGTDKNPIQTKDAARLTLIFSYLKKLELGSEKIRFVGAAGVAEKTINDMTQPELADALRQLSEKQQDDPLNDMLRTQLWAILFEVLARTTRKYPHLAQQFALIANDVCCAGSTSRVLQLATGEGKSHFVALRAAKQAAAGKTVDICTAKRTLAERDLDDYKAFFSYLGLTTAYIHPKSTRETYTDAQIHYTTPGDLSLFMDEQAYQGKPIEINEAIRKQRVVLLDEFDFLLYDEGRKTQYNYAKPTGKTPKEMIWFYQAVNTFYLTNKATLPRGIVKPVLHAFYAALIAGANGDDDKIAMVNRYADNPLKLAQLLQASHQAHQLVRGTHFSVVNEDIVVGSETYPMREIVPLSSDNQKMHGSTFSAGVHQLLAVRLNTEAKHATDEHGKPKEEPQNFHIHPESDIISSQIAAERIKELWGEWEGFTGTVSPMQAAMLHAESNTLVLHVPTNQRDLRKWHNEKFYDSEQNRLQDVARQIHLCLTKKQSILFSCKDDKEVAALYKALERMRDAGFLTADDYSSIIPYTNEREEKPSEILAEKSRREDWRGGKKQKGICLIASCFGRGDNAEVEAVFLMSASDNNDKLQKGGRTARNGEEGQVFQFYIESEWKQEEQTIINVLLAKGINVEAIYRDKFRITLTLTAAPTRLATFDPEGTAKERYERVMLLREYVFNLDNQANQGYRSVVAKFSSWGMSVLAKLTEHPKERAELTGLYSQFMKEVEEQWTKISTTGSAGEKIRTIELVTRRLATNFAERYREKTRGEIEIVDFTLRDYLIPELEVIVPPKHESTATEHAIATICTRLANLPDTTLTNERMSRIPHLLETLSAEGNESKLRRFVERLSTFESAEQVVGELEIVVESITTPSDDADTTFAAAEYAYEAATFLADVSSETRGTFDRLIHVLPPALRTKVIEHLLIPNVLTAEARIAKILPILRYLERFSPDERALWGADYIAAFDSLTSETTPDILQLRIENSPPMSWSHFNGLWRLLQTFERGFEAGLDYGTLIHQLASSIKAAPEQRMRMLTKWESWANDLPAKEAAEFLLSFTAVMAKYQEGKNWDVFVNLVNKTHTWWNKDAVKGDEAAYKTQLIALWHTLAGYDDISAINDVISSSFAHPGKSWFQLLQINLALTSDIQARHHGQINLMWNAINASPRMKKADKTAIFKGCIDGLAALYERGLTADEIGQLSALNGPGLKAALELSVKHEDVLAARKNLLGFILQKLHERTDERMIGYIELTISALTTDGLSEDDIEFLKTTFEANKRQWLALPQDKFDWIMAYLSAHLNPLLKSRELLPMLLEQAFELTTPLARLERLGQLLASEAIVKAEEADLAQLKDTLSAAKDNGFFKPHITGDDKFAWAMQTIEKNFKNLITHKSLLPQLLIYSVRVADLSRIEKFSATLLHPAVLNPAGKDGINYLIGEFKKVERRLFEEVSTDKFNWLMEEMPKLVGHLLRTKDKNLLPCILSYTCDPAISLDRLNTMTGHLISIYSSTGDTYLSYFMEQFEALRRLSDDYFAVFKRLLTNDRLLFCDYKHLLPFMGQLVASHVLPQRIQETSQLFIDVVKEKKGVIPKDTDTGDNPSAQFLLGQLRDIAQLDSEGLYGILLDAVHDHPDVFIKHKRLLPRLIEWARGNIDPSRLKKLMSILVTVSQTSPDYLELFMEQFSLLKAVGKPSYDAVVKVLDKSRAILSNHLLLPTLVAWARSAWGPVPPAHIEALGDVFIKLVDDRVIENSPITANPTAAFFLQHLNSIAYLPEDSYSVLLSSIREHAIPFKKHQGILPWLITLAQARVDSRDLHAFTQILVRASEHPKASADSLDRLQIQLDLVRELGDRRKFDAIISFINTNIEKVLQYPLVLEKAVEKARNRLVTATECQAFNNAILKVVDYHETYPTLSLEHLINDGILHVAADHYQQLDELLADNGEYVAELLFDRVVHYTADPSLRTYPDADYREVMRMFYTVAKENRGQVAAIMDARAIKQLFAVDNDTPTRRKQRVLFTHMLMHNAFTTSPGEDPRLGAHNYQWTTDKNEQLLGLLFNAYVAKTKAILDVTPSASEKPKVRDLTEKNQYALLRLADELGFIGRAPRVEPAETRDKVESLRAGLEKSVQSYTASLFKSNERKVQLANLKRDMTRLMGDHYGDAHGTVRYQAVIAALRVARTTAIQSDTARNASASWWFKMNSGGKSRYLRTLDEMEDLVLRHWVDDTPALQKFDIYRDISTEEFAELVDHFSRQVVDHVTLTYPEDRDRQRQSFFTNTSTKTAILDLRDALDTRELATSAGISNLKEQLESSLPKLPGHLIPLAQEILDRSGALIQHLQELEGQHHPGGAHFGE